MGELCAGSGSGSCSGRAELGMDVGTVEAWSPRRPLCCVKAGGWKSDGVEFKSQPCRPCIDCVTLDQKQGLSEPVSFLIKCVLLGK